MVIVRRATLRPMVTDDYLGHRKGVYVRFRDAGRSQEFQARIKRQGQIAEVTAFCNLTSSATQSAQRDATAARSCIGTNLRVSCPIQTCRGRAIFCSGSVIISCHCASQPAVRGMANRTVNISGLKPMAW